jgi:endonuclease YncB( thermonuclease family)
MHHSRMKHFLGAVALCISAATSVSAAPISGQADVVDGDTLSIRGQSARIRLYGVDAPEGQQTCEDGTGKRYLCGSRAADALSALIGRNGRVSCEEEDRDRYGRIVAVCRANGREINAELIRKGWALEYKQYSDARYAGDEADARKAKRGLWAGRFVEPWDWRRGERLASEASTGADRKCASKATSRARARSITYRAAGAMRRPTSMNPAASAGSARKMKLGPPDGELQEARGPIMRSVLIAAFAVMAIAGPAAAGSTLDGPAKPSVDRIKEFVVAQRQSCKAASSCQEAVQMWCGGYSRADADDDGIPCESVCRSKSQVDAIKQRIGC